MKKCSSSSFFKLINTGPKWQWRTQQACFMYSIHLNRHVCTFISGKVRLLILIEAKRQTLPEINVYTRLFGSIEYVQRRPKGGQEGGRQGAHWDFSRLKLIYIYYLNAPKGARGVKRTGRT